MLYSFPATWTLNGVATHANDVLSGLDQGFVSGAAMYPGRPGPHRRGDPQIDGPKVEASIGAPGEEDLYAFDVSSDGLYEVSTRGRPTSTSPSSAPTATPHLVAEDDDSGYGVNARMRAGRTPGRYVVQVRHYRPSGTGTYSIRARGAADYRTLHRGRMPSGPSSGRMPPTTRRHTSTPFPRA